MMMIRTGGAMEWVNMDSDTELEIGVWAHLALVRDGNYISLSINGYEVGSASQELVPEAQAQLGWVVLGCNKDMDGGTTNMEVARSAVTPRALNTDNFILAPVVPSFDIGTDVARKQIAGLFPNDYSLHQNYPNPFNPTTTIEYEISKASDVTINVYNLQGQLVRALVNNEMHTSGTYSVVWDGRDLFGNQVCSGLYIYQIKASDFSASKRMLLIK